MIMRWSGSRLDEEYAQALARVTLSGVLAALFFAAWHTSYRQEFAPG